MQLSTDFIFRILGALFFCIIFAFFGIQLAPDFEGDPLTFSVIFGLVGLLFGLILTPAITLTPLRRINSRLAKMAPEHLVAVLAGIFLGLMAAALVSLPLSFLPTPFRQIMPLATALVFCYLGVVILTSRQKDLRSLFRGFRTAESAAAAEAAPAESFILLDTSVVIDGRIADISKTGFVRSTLLVPNFVLLELQHIADSADPLRRGRGRLGLEILSTLQNESLVPTKITDMDVSEVRDVDSKLVSLARHLHCPIMTNDYNLNRVAELQGVTVLNVNDLANAVKVTCLPGEELTVKIIQEGREANQGVGFLEDGTMVVVENGAELINKRLTVTVTKVLQTSAGRMIFART